jgi:putative DNA primase/helicase
MSKASERVEEAVKAGDDNAEIERLAKLDDLAYARVRKEAADKLGIGVGDLNKLVEKRRKAFAATGDRDDDSMAGRPVSFDDPEPSDEEVDGAELLSNMSSGIRSYVVLGATEGDALALWVVFTHAFDAFDVAPKINIASVEKRCGKSRLVEVVSYVVARRLLVSSGSPASLMRVIEGHHPTLLLDEIDVLLKKSPELREAIRGLLNAGFNRSGSDFIINVPSPNGGYEPRLFSAYTPQILSGIGDLPDTVRDRSVTIEMRRKKRDEKIRRLRRRDGGDLRAMCSKAARWAADNMAALRDAVPVMPEGLDDRAADAWEPLIAIADLAGGEWPDRARRAALKLSGSREDEGDSIGAKPWRLGWRSSSTALGPSGARTISP